LVQDWSQWRTGVCGLMKLSSFSWLSLSQPSSIVSDSWNICPEIWTFNPNSRNRRRALQLPFVFFTLLANKRLFSGISVYWLSIHFLWLMSWKILLFMKNHGSPVA
jgi:hypothetical protein